VRNALLLKAKVSDRDFSNYEPVIESRRKIPNFNDDLWTDLVNLRFKLYVPLIDKPAGDQELLGVEQFWWEPSSDGNEVECLDFRSNFGILRSKIKISTDFCTP
jgi:hypothetical protein